MRKTHHQQPEKNTDTHTNTEMEKEKKKEEEYKTTHTQTTTTYLFFLSHSVLTHVATTRKCASFLPHPFTIRCKY